MYPEAMSFASPFTAMLVRSVQTLLLLLASSSRVRKKDSSLCILG